MYHQTNPTFICTSHPALSSVLRVFPDTFQVHQVDRRGVSTLVKTMPGAIAPSYKQLEAMLKAMPGSSMNKTWLQRAQEELKFNEDSLKNGPN